MDETVMFPFCFLSNPSRIHYSATNSTRNQFHISVFKSYWHRLNDFPEFFISEVNMHLLEAAVWPYDQKSEIFKMPHSWLLIYMILASFALASNSLQHNLQHTEPVSHFGFQILLASSERFSWIFYLGGKYAFTWSSRVAIRSKVWNFQNAS